MKYLRAVKVSGRIIFHGEGLVSAVAANIAESLGCDLLFSNRGFSTLSTMIELSIDKLSAKLIKHFMNWTIQHF